MGLKLTVIMARILLRMSHITAPQGKWRTIFLRGTALELAPYEGKQRKCAQKNIHAEAVMLLIENGLPKSVETEAVMSFKMSG
jgi:hypothetical protein